MAQQSLERRAWAFLQAVDRPALLTQAESLPPPPQARWIRWGVVGLILLGAVTTILGTVPGLQVRYGFWFGLVQVGGLTVFALEYLLRLWAAPLDWPQLPPLAARLRYAISLPGLMDLLSALPILFLAFSLHATSGLLLLRLLSLFKLARYSRALNLIDDVFRAKRDDLVAAISLVLMLLVLSSSAMYFLERGAQPDKFGSIPQALWWGVITLSTIGYGDVYPVTPLGRVVGAIAAMLGAGLFAFPAAIITVGFAEVMRKRRSGGQKVCPHCGRPLEPEPWVDPRQPPA